MIKTIIFDFGNIFINLDISKAKKETYKSLEVQPLPKGLLKMNDLYEVGGISTDEFINFYIKNYPKLSKNDVINLWNSILKDFPLYRLNFLKELKKNSKYKLILLSNTNQLHIDWIKAHIDFYTEFEGCFDAFYLSHEIHLRKPNKDIFEFVLNEHDLNANECVFIDDNKDNINTANTLGIKVWHLNPETEDVIDLFKTQKHLF